MGIKNYLVDFTPFTIITALITTFCQIAWKFIGAYIGLNFDS